MKKSFISFFLVLFATVSLPAQTTPWAPSLERLGDHLFYFSADGRWGLELSGSFDLTAYAYADEPLGFVEPRFGDQFHASPRLTLDLEAFYGERLTGFAKIRADDGIDPGRKDGEIRLEEIFLRATVIPGNLDLQAGRFATVFGNWAGRHGSWDSALITAPLPYDHPTSVVDDSAPESVAEFRRRADFPDFPRNWIPVIWGPVYTNGVAVFTTWQQWDWAFSATNRPLGVQPYSWNDYDIAAPTYTSRIGWRPSAAWQFGLSGAVGPYLQKRAGDTLPAGQGRGDFEQLTGGVDFRYEGGPWQVWGEVIVNRFEVPLVGDADSLSYYLESKYKWTPRLFSGIRWGQQFYSSIDTPEGSFSWDNDVLRFDKSLGYRFDRFTQLKAQYSFQYQDASFQRATHLLAGEFTVRF